MVSRDGLKLVNQVCCLEMMSSVKEQDCGHMVTVLSLSGLCVDVGLFVKVRLLKLRYLNR